MTLTWVESLGGPLVVVPVSALAVWQGSTPSGVIADDYDRACAVDDWAAAIPVGGEGAQALVLGDEPARTCYLAGRRAFLRWLAADSEAGLLAAAERVLADRATAWNDCGTWVSDGPAVLMDSAFAGAELGTAYVGGGMPEQAPVPLPAGRWTVRAIHAEADERNWVGLVQLLPQSS